MQPGSRPRQFRQNRVLIVGCGDVGLRLARLLHGRLRVFALTSTPGRIAPLRAAGIVPLRGDLDVPASLRRLAGLAHSVVHLAPPPVDGSGTRDPRTLALTRALRRRAAPERLVYASTSGVYGDCGGDLVRETRAVNPQTPRAARRVHAERLIRHAACGRMAASILRIPGIYASDREGGTPRARLERGTPVLEPEDDVHTNHIHADDLARVLVAALRRGRPQRIYNVSDDSGLKMGDYFDLAADLYGMPRPPRVPLTEARRLLPATTLSFMGESRVLDNTRMKAELGVKLRYPTARQGLGAGSRSSPCGVEAIRHS